MVEVVWSVSDGWGSVGYPVVRTHPETCPKALYVGCSHTHRVKDMTEDDATN